MLTDRANLLCLLRVLEEYSDAEHIMTMGEIIAKLKSNYDLKLDRRTIYGAVEILNTMGYDISDFSDNGKGYYLRERSFEQSEIRLLTDAVYSFPYISEAQTNGIVKKLQGELSVHQRRNFRNLYPVRGNHKTENKAVFLNIEMLDEAITNRVQVSFDYLTYGLDKKLHRRRKTKYIMNPYGMVCTNEHYYLVCRMVGKEPLSYYRIDLISNIELLDTPVEVFDGDDFENTLRRTTYAFTGKPEQVKLRCKNYIIGDVLDQFGTDIAVTPDGAEDFIASFAAVPYGIKFWALQYIPHAEVLEPKWLRNEIIDCLKQSPYNE